MKSFIASPGLILLLALASAPLTAQNYTFSNVAGSQDQGGSTDGTGTIARFVQPRSLALDSAGSLFVCSAGGTLIRRVSPAGVVTTVADLSAFWSYPGFGSMAVDRAGNLFLADLGGFVIRKLTPTGVVSTFAGSGVYGSSDGPAAIAQFTSPSSLVFDSIGNLFISDSSSIRKITPAGNLSTFAGSPTLNGSTDGIGTAARFSGSIALGIDRADTLYASDKLNHTIRKITPTAVVTTFAGRASFAGSADGLGTNAHFFTPAGISVDSAGNIFVADNGNGTFRRITPDGVVTTIGGKPAAEILATTLLRTGTGANAHFSGPATILASSPGTLFVLDNVSNAVYQAVPDSPLAEPLITKQPLSSIVIPGSSVALSLEAAGPGLNYQWAKNGAAISGATGASYTIASASAADSGDYAAVITNRNGATTSFSAVLTVDSAAVALTYGFSTIAGLAEITPGLYPPTESDGNGIGNEAQFQLPSAVTIDSEGNLFVLDSGASSIRRISPTGATTRLSLTAPSGASSSISGGYGLAVDRAGNLFASDLGHNALLKITPAGVVTTLATQLSFPKGVAVDNAGNVYVASLLGNAIVKVTAAGVVSTLVNTALSSPQGVAVDAAGNVYIADTNNSVIRKLTPSGALSILAGSPGQVGGSDGTGSAARFRSPQGLAVDSAGNVFVADTGNNLIRRITPAGVVNTIGGSIADGFVSPSGGGLAVGSRWADGVGANARFAVPTGIAVDSAGNLFIADKANNNIRRGTPVALATSNTARLSNVSIRAGAGSDSQTLIVGVTVGGAGTSGGKTLLVRGTGPALTAFGVPGVLTDPVLTFFNSGGTSIADSDDWAGDAQVIAQGTALGAFALNAGSKDAALVSTIPSGGYTVQLTGKAGATGVGLVEVYDATASFTTTTPRLINVSARTQVGTGGNILITGFVVAGSGTRQVLIRATGPALAGLGVVGTLVDPKLELYNGVGVKLGENDNWVASTASAQTSVGAFALLANSKDAVLIATLAPGSYTAQVSGVGGTTGVALVEIYELP